MIMDELFVGDRIVKDQTEKIESLRRTIMFLCKQMLTVSAEIDAGEYIIAQAKLGGAVGDSRYEFF